MNTMLFGLIFIFAGALLFYFERFLEHLFEDKNLKYDDEVEENINLEDTLTMKQINEERIKNDNKIGKIIEEINEKNSQE